MKLLTTSLALLVLLAVQPAFAGREDFHPGPVIPDYGRIADVDNEFPIPEGTEFHVAFDLEDAADAGQVNRGLESLARFLNMHVANGVPEENIDLAIVIHGGAVQDVTTDTHYEPRKGEANANAPLVAALIEHGVRVYVCGQSAAFNDVTNDDLLPGVRMALSAMTAHAQLQMEGYTLNPF
jgi:intracellular sulfur oxidation DsrE/DsrF family protein